MVALPIDLEPPVRPHHSKKVLDDMKELIVGRCAFAKDRIAAHAMAS
jgi:hypothetical protein